LNMFLISPANETVEKPVFKTVFLFPMETFKLFP